MGQAERGPVCGGWVPPGGAERGDMEVGSAVAVGVGSAVAVGVAEASGVAVGTADGVGFGVSSGGGTS